jgi:exodeoxyribonuclease VII small subunit
MRPFIIDIFGGGRESYGMAKRGFNFEKAYRELEEIVTDLESREIDLDKDLPKFEEGMKLTKQLMAKMSEAENTVKEISLKYGDTTL